MEKWTLISLNEMCKDEERLISFLKERNLLKSEMVCPKCGWQMRMGKINWICCKIIKSKKGRKPCTKRISIRKGTWFSKTKLKIGDVLKLTYMLIHNLEQKYISKELNISKNTVSQWSVFLEQVLIDRVQYSSEVLGGPGEIVEIDESKFGRRKYNRGHPVEGQWVFGGIQRGTHKIFMVPIECRDSKTLTGLIKKWIKPGSTIILNCWKGYKIINQEDYKDLTANHSIQFKNEQTGAHTNAIESLWRHIKKFLPNYNREKKNFIWYLAHFHFIKQCKAQQKDLFNMILEEISKITFDESPEQIESGSEKLDETDVDSEG